MPSHFCEWMVSGLSKYFDNPREMPCGKPAVACIVWPGGKEIVYWYCAEHFDERIKFVKDCGRMDVLRASGVR